MVSREILASTLFYSMLFEVKLQSYVEYVHIRYIILKGKEIKVPYPYCPQVECMQLQSELIGIFSEGRHFMQNIQPFNFWCQKELNKPMRLHWAHKNPYSCTRPIILSILAGVSVKVFVMSTEQAGWLIIVIVVRNRSLHI